jgi:hypothetical protein
MTQPSLSASANSQRNELTFSDERRRDGLLRTAWNRITDGFKAKPEPKASWYETATGDVTPWKKVVTPIRAAIQAALLTGDKQLIEQTLEGARAFCRELEADFLSLVPSAEEASVVSIALDETKLEGPANEAEISLVQNPTPIEAERAIGPLAKQHECLGTLVARCRRLAREKTLEADRARFITPRTTALFRGAQ